jgi:hypothetical protein
MQRGQRVQFDWIKAKETEPTDLQSRSNKLNIFEVS